MESLLIASPQDEGRKGGNGVVYDYNAAAPAAAVAMADSDRRRPGNGGIRPVWSFALKSYFNKVTFIGLGIGIVIEKMSISWLNNRMGCTHYRLQKFIELDVRH